MVLCYFLVCEEPSRADREAYCASEVERGDGREGVFALRLPPTPNRYRYATDSISPFRFKVDRPNTGNRSVLMCTPYTLYVHALTHFMCTPLHTLCAHLYTLYVHTFTHYVHALTPQC